AKGKGKRMSILHKDTKVELGKTIPLTSFTADNLVKVLNASDINGPDGEFIARDLSNEIGNPGSLSLEKIAPYTDALKQKGFTGIKDAVNTLAESLKPNDTTFNVILEGKRRVAESLDWYKSKSVGGDISIPNSIAEKALKDFWNYIRNSLRREAAKVGLSENYDTANKEYEIFKGATQEITKHIGTYNKSFKRIELDPDKLFSLVKEGGENLANLMNNFEKLPKNLNIGNTLQSHVVSQSLGPSFSIPPLTGFLGSMGLGALDLLKHGSLASLTGALAVGPAVLAGTSPRLMSQGGRLTAQTILNNPGLLSQLSRSGSGLTGKSILDLLK
ncbi:MAG: hypothetical protein AABY22_36305, partial [Nanoarchaeota archaeon]